MLTTPSFKKSLIVEQFQGNYLNFLGHVGKGQNLLLTVPRCGVTSTHQSIVSEAIETQLTLIISLLIVYFGLCDRILKVEFQIYIIALSEQREVWESNLLWRIADHPFQKLANLGSSPRLSRKKISQSECNCYWLSKLRGARYRSSYNARAIIKRLAPFCDVVHYRRAKFDLMPQSTTVCVVIVFGL